MQGALQQNCFWFVANGTPIVLFFSNDVLPPRYGKKWTKVLSDTAQSTYIPTILFQGRGLPTSRPACAHPCPTISHFYYLDTPYLLLVVHVVHRFLVHAGLGHFCRCCCHFHCHCCCYALGWVPLFCPCRWRRVPLFCLHEGCVDLDPVLGRLVWSFRLVLAVGYCCRAIPHSLQLTQS